ncbi:heparinase II/III family protein [Vibrio gallaecicus]|uniref:heparinase II/III family protein n=1 Tax=Vibrio gallaecicus TaxID=552386 RepID=UPI0010C9BE3B|nr:alginate lyase family protein [Vibrio gallaecicus]MDN3614828.1 alginate lyase family protein [Vibrio gallaecicus]
MLNKIIFFWNTVKHLKFGQIWYRLYYKLYKPEVKSYYSHEISRDLWVFESPQPNQQSVFSDFSVNFLSVGSSLSSKNIWNDENKSKLWLYNLHYFDDLSSYNCEEREKIHSSIILRWINENPPCAGNGWEPYPLSLRLVNWVKWLSKKKHIDGVILNSIWQQADALTQQLEYHILGNHLFANGKALTFVGSFLLSGDSRSYLNMGLNILDKEIDEQFLFDGAHFELSPMYHQILLWDLLDLINLAKTSDALELKLRLPKWTLVAKKALTWLVSMIHPDGDISFFNDGSFGIGADPKLIFQYGEELGLKVDASSELLVTNKESGYSRVKTNEYTLFFDHAKIGPDYLPGHAHADSLSFELSIGKQRVFVNSGTSLYGTSAERVRQRQTAAHNTVSVAGMDSSQVWSGFRVAKRAYARLDKVSTEGQQVQLVASHNGYMQQSPRVTHTRALDCAPDNMVINDALSKEVPACFHLHLHPDMDVIKLSDSELKIMHDNELLCVFVSTEPIVIKDCSWHPEFGKTIANKKIEIVFTSGHLRTEIKKIKRDS